MGAAGAFKKAAARPDRSLFHVKVVGHVAVRC
jgi:hypothetical protein